jgi:outer membrane protein assembly factor BamB
LTGKQDRGKEAFMTLGKTRGVLALALALLALGGGVSRGEAVAPASTDPSSPKGFDAASWPQWRGPTRDGIAPTSPKLLDTWPKGGPKLLWKSEFIPGAEDGGCGSVVVADGKAFVYVNWGGPVAASTKKLKELGWEEGVPEELAKKIEVARTSADRVKLKTEAEIDAYIKEFTAKLNPQLSQKYADFIKKRVGKQAGWDGCDWPTLVRWSALREKEFPSIDALAKEMGILIFHYGNPFFSGSEWCSHPRTFSDTVVCLDAATGKELWKKDLPSKGPGGKWAGSSTPAVVNGRCYAVGNAGLYCLSAKDGSVIWQINGKYSNSSPLVDNGAVYITEPDLTAYNAETGQLLWKTPMGDRDGGYNGPNFSVALWTSGGKSYLVGLGEHAFYCVDPRNGSLLWKVNGVAAPEGSTTPSICGDIAAFRGDGGDYAFKITPQDAKQLWKTPPGAWRSSSLCVYQNCVYAVDNGKLRCLDLKTGQVKWEKKEVHNHYSSPILADGKLLCPTGGRDFNYLVMLKATPEGFEELGQLGQSPDERHIVSCCSSPALAGGKLYLRGTNALLCYDLRVEGK